MTSKFVGLQFGWQKELDGKVFHSVFCISLGALAPEGGGGGGGAPYNGLYGEARPERDTFFRLEVYKRVEFHKLRYK